MDKRRKGTVEIKREQRVTKVLGRLTCPYFGKSLPPDFDESKCRSCPFRRECEKTYQVWVSNFLKEFREWLKEKENGLRRKNSSRR